MAKRMTIEEMIDRDLLSPDALAHAEAFCREMYGDDWSEHLHQMVQDAVDEITDEIRDDKLITGPADVGPPSSETDG